MNETTSTNEIARVLPGALGQQTLNERERIQDNFDALGDRRKAIIATREIKLQAIAALRREVEECDAVLEACEVERQDLIAMDDALAEQYRALERILVRRAGR